MNLKNSICVCLLFFTFGIAGAQNKSAEYVFGEKYDDRYKYSNLLAISDDGSGGSILVRTYYTGVILSPKGYYIEHYNENLELIGEYNYKIKNTNFVDAFIKNGQVYLLFLEYNVSRQSYDYKIHRSPIVNFSFKEETLLSIPSVEVTNPLDKNYYNRDFGSGFTTAVLFNETKSAFAISAHFKKGKDNKHFIFLFDATLNKLMEHDFSDQVEEKNYAFENIVVSKDLTRAYIVGKAYFKQQRFAATERKFQYELVQLSRNGIKTQVFDEAGKYSEALTPIISEDRLLCVGFYSDRRDNRYNGLAYFDLDANTLAINSSKYNPFSQQFMADKFGKEDDKEIKNLIFKNVSLTSDKSILFNAEEYFVTTSIQQDASGSRLKIERFHYNDMVSAKINAKGDMVWARNVNKSEVTQGDGAYASYSSYTKGNNTYFFISTASENPQQLSNERIVFKQGLGRNRNVFLIKLDEKGDLSYEKIIDDKEARLPLMVSMPLSNGKDDSMLFYAKRGSKKQLVKVLLP